jgi:RNA polymerase sigma-70 factor (ECF subfamily)
VTDANVSPYGPEEPTSSTLLSRVRAREQDAWDRLVSLYTPLVYRWCRQAGLQAADAADVGQDVFQAVARRMGDYHHDAAGDTFRGWLRAITRNKIIDHARRRKPGWQGAGGAESQEAILNLPDELSSAPSGDSLAEEARTLYRRAVELIRAEFEERTWQAFWRVVVEDRAPDEVARELNTTVNAVYLAKSRILRRLREEFAELVEV